MQSSTVHVTTRHEYTAASTNQRAECGRCGRKAAGTPGCSSFEALCRSMCDQPGPVNICRYAWGEAACALTPDHDGPHESGGGFSRMWEPGVPMDEYQAWRMQETTYVNALPRPIQRPVAPQPRRLYHPIG